MTLGLLNANPVVHAKRERYPRLDDPHTDDAVDPLEIYDILFLLYEYSQILFFFLFYISAFKFVIFDW